VAKGFFVLFGPPGVSKSTEAATAFQKALYLKSAPNVLHYYDQWLKTPAGTHSGLQLPAKSIVLESYSIDGNVNFGPDGMPAAVPQAATIVGVIQSLWRKVAEEKRDGKPRSYDWLVLDEAGEFWSRVFEEILASSVTRDGKTDSRKAYGTLATWTNSVVSLLRQLVSLDVGVGLIAHEREPEMSEQKKGGPKFPSAGVMGLITASADGALLRTYEDRELGKPPARVWVAHGNQHWVSKMRGIAPEDFERIKDLPLSEIIKLAGFDLN